MDLLKSRLVERELEALREETSWVMEEQAGVCISRLSLKKQDIVERRLLERVFLTGNGLPRNSQILKSRLDMGPLDRDRRTE